MDHPNTVCLRVTKGVVVGTGWACGDYLLGSAHISHQLVAQGLPRPTVVFWYLLTPSPLDCLQLPQQPIAGHSNTDLHSPQRPWSCLGVQPAILLNYFWDGKNKGGFCIQSVQSLWIYTVKSIFPCTVLLANACREFVPDSSQQSKYLFGCDPTIWSWDVKCCRSWDIWIHILSRSAGVCKHTSSHPREYAAVRADCVKLFHPSLFEAVQDWQGQREHIARDSAAFRLKISAGNEFWSLFQGLCCFDKSILLIFISTGKVRKIEK